MAKVKQQNLFSKHWKHQFTHGGNLRAKRAGRGQRPLSTKEPIHLIFKANKECVRGGLRNPRRFALINRIIKIYAARFYIKIDIYSIQNDHIHFVIRTSWRRNYTSFFRVVAGQIAQRFEKEGLLSFASVTDTPKRSAGKRKLWKFRPFSRVVKGWRAYKIVLDYVQLNEQEACGKIKYNKLRLRGLSAGEWEILWS